MKDAKVGPPTPCPLPAGGSPWHVLGRRWKDSATKAYGETTFLRRRCARRYQHRQTHRFSCNSSFFRVIQHIFFIVVYCSHELNHRSHDYLWFVVPRLLYPDIGIFLQDPLTGNAIRQNVQILSRLNRWVRTPRVSNLEIDLAHWFFTE